MLTLAAVLAAPLAALADAERGADVFDENCAECHSVASSLKNKKGPSLFGVAGRNAGKIDGFHYSDALLASGIVWTPDRIDAYVTQPKAVIPGGKMKFDGIADTAERKDLLDFLAEQK